MPEATTLKTTCLDSWLGREAQQRSAAHRVRRRQALRPLDAVRVHDGQQALLNFSSNDYLGLSGHPDLATAASAVLESVGTGSGAAALVTGYREEHQQLETALAEFLQREAVLLFSSGYLANLAVATSLAGRDDCIVQDRLCHASLIDAARLCQARLLRYRHTDIDSLRQQLARRPDGRALVMTDGIFSMDGDMAPLAELSGVAADAGAWLVVDDAHGIGVVGADGRGSVETAGLDQQQVPVLVGTLGKAFGCTGAFVAGSRALVEHLVNQARTYLFTTAMPPAMAAAGLAGLRRVREDGWRREKLVALIAEFRAGAAEKGIELLPSATPIQPLLMGSAEDALDLADGLRQRGFLVVAIRPPTVPEGSSRLRITLTSAHTPEQVGALLEAIEACLEP